MIKVLLYFLISSIIVISCSNEEKVHNENISDKDLAIQYCSGCHLYPEPSLLPKSKWENVISEMRPYMGLFDNELQRDSLIGNDPFEKKIFNQRNVFPKSPMMSEENYSRVLKYYLNESPDSVDFKIPTKDIQVFKGFEIKEPELKVKIPSTTVVEMQSGNIFVGDVNTRSLSIFDKNLKLRFTRDIGQAPVHMNFFENVIFVTIMGSFTPTDQPLGQIMAIDNKSGQSIILIDSLQRPVHTAVDDLNNDGLPDLVISEFGNKTGQLSLWLNKGQNKFERKNLRLKPGSIKSFIKDMDNDGDLDIVTLFAQADEGIYLFTNDGNANFTEKTIKRFPSIYGSSSIDFTDFNNDGIIDIVYCNGDNADLSIISKPYHGIRIFTGDGEDWEEELFLHMNGAYKAISKDFDLDGDVDIAAISFFPDYEKAPQESFVFFENDGKNNFISKSFENSSRGRWLVMDSFDYDNDGDEDIVLGGLTLQVSKDQRWVKKWMKNGLPFLLLENSKN